MAILAIIRLAVVIYLAASVVVFSVSLWLRRKLRSNPSRNEMRYFECPWYIAPRGFPDRLAKRLVNPAFLSICDHAAVTCGALFIIAVLLFLFLLITS